MRGGGNQRGWVSKQIARVRAEESVRKAGSLLGTDRWVSFDRFHRFGGTEPADRTHRRRPGLCVVQPISAEYPPTGRPTCSRRTPLDA